MEVPEESCVFAGGEVTQNIIVRTNLPDIMNNGIVYSGAVESWFSCVSSSIIEGSEDADGCVQVEFVFAAQENHTKSSRTCTLRLADYNSGYGKTLTITQQDGSGDVEIGDVVLALFLMPTFTPCDIYHTKRNLRQTTTTDRDLPPHHITTQISTSLYIPQYTHYYPAIHWYAYYTDGTLSPLLPTGWTEVNDKIGDPCPSGWRVPTGAELEELVKKVGDEYVYFKGTVYEDTKCMKFVDGTATMLLPFAGIRACDRLRDTRLSPDAGIDRN